MRSVMGLTPPHRGRVLWQGRDITGWAPYRVARAGIGFVPEDRRIFAELTVWENLDVAARAARRRGAGPSTAVFELFPVLARPTRRLGGFLSGGEQQMLTIARTLDGQSRAAVAGRTLGRIGAAGRRDAARQDRRTQAQGLTILLAEQGVDFSLALADRVYVLEKGNVRYTGPAAALRDDKQLSDRLLAL